MGANSVAQSIAQTVQKMYEAYPYPHYPLFLSLRWQDGYIGSSMFARRLKEAGEHRYHPDFFNGSVLVIGCGEVQPYILRHVEPSSSRLTCIDLSKNSLRRAKARLMLSPRSAEFHQVEVDEYLQERSAFYDHMDCYGVLMCLPNPSETLKFMAQRLAPGGTIRLMVYNRQARHWIFHIQRSFALMDLNIYEEKDLEKAQQILRLLMKVSPPLKKKLDMMGSSMIDLKPRLVDTFFHKREIQVDLRGWFEMFADAQLQPFALFDRYGELDDLSNPLTKMPKIRELEERTNDGRFENNLEIHLCHKSPGMHQEAKQEPSWPSAYQTLRQQWRSPPRLWFSAEETQGISRINQQILWGYHSAFVNKGRNIRLDRYIRDMGVKAAQRLARLGAILPQQVKDPYLREELQGPMVEAMPSREWGAPKKLEASFPLVSLIQKVLTDKDLFSRKRLQQILQRLQKAQD